MDIRSLVRPLKENIDWAAVASRVEWEEEEAQDRKHTNKCEPGEG